MSSHDPATSTDHSGDLAADLQSQLERGLVQPDLDHVELTAPHLRLRIDAVPSGQLFFWITYIATTDDEFATASAGRAAMRSFPWTMPFKTGLELPQAALPALCRWQRAYATDTAAFTITLLTRRFQTPLDAVNLSWSKREGATDQANESTPEGTTPPPSAAKSQKVWLRDVTAWFMRTH